MAHSCAAGGILTHELPEPDAVVMRDHLRRFFADHDRWRICVAAHDIRHDACVRHTQVPHAHHPQRWIDHAGRPTICIDSGNPSGV
jgi:hypothetical protein